VQRPLRQVRRSRHGRPHVTSPGQPLAVERAYGSAQGAAFDNPGLIVPCVVGDGAVLPVLHLNGWKIANPAVLARIPAGRRLARPGLSRRILELIGEGLTNRQIGAQMFL
jgi:XFP N-terminal domain